MMQMMGRMTPQQMQQMHDTMMGRMTPEQRAQMMQGGMMGGMAHGSTPPAQPGAAAASPSTRAFMAANEKMHRDMDITFTGNADRDFAAGMIPHHQGAIDMARVALDHARDPEVPALAESIIRDQEREIAQLRAILARLAQR